LCSFSMKVPVAYFFKLFSISKRQLSQGTLFQVVKLVFEVNRESCFECDFLRRMIQLL
jgi:hypothetical protein